MWWEEGNIGVLGEMEGENWNVPECSSGMEPLGNVRGLTSWVVEGREEADAPAGASQRMGGYCVRAVGPGETPACGLVRATRALSGVRTGVPQGVC